MKNRKPRFAKYELERMSRKELEGLMLRVGLKPAFSIITSESSSSSLSLNNNDDDDSYPKQRQRAVMYIIKSNKVDVIASPEPFKFKSIHILRRMKVGQLRKVMADAGVFFDAVDVVEKEDMVQIFLGSGRVILLETETDLLETDNDNNNNNNDDDNEVVIIDNDSYNYNKDSTYGIHNQSNCKRPRTDTTPTSASTSTSTNNEDNDIGSISIKGLRNMARTLNVNISDCIEKREMVDRLQIARRK